MLIFFRRNVNRLINILKKLFRGKMEITDSSINSQLSSNIVVSLTSYNKRINKVHLVIRSILNQTVKPLRIILWLDVDEFTIQSLPKDLIQLQKKGLEIYFTDNIKSYKKIIPTIELLRREGNDNLPIVTIDDDIIYPSNLIEFFEKESFSYPDTVLCNIGHEMLYRKGTLLEYNKWIHSSCKLKPSLNIFPTGAGGVYYPHGCFYKDVLDSELFMSLCPNADDVWLKVMTLLNNTNCKIINRRYHTSYEFVGIDGAQDIGLFNDNLQGGNDIAISTVFKHYNL